MKPITPALLLVAAASCAVSLAGCGKSSPAAPETPAAAAPAPDAGPAEPAKDAAPPPPNGDALCPMIREAFLDLLKPGASASPSAEACGIGVSGQGMVRVSIPAKGPDEPPPSAAGDPIRRPAPFGDKAQMAVSDAGKASSRMVIWVSSAGGHLATIEVEPGKPIDDAMLARIAVDTSSFLDAVTVDVLK